MREKISGTQLLTSTVVTHILLELLREKGIDAVKIEQETGIDNSLMNDPEIRLPYSQVLNLLRFSIDVTKDPALALHITTTQLDKEMMHFVACIAMNSRNLLEAAKHQCQYGRVICEADSWEVKENREEVIFSYTLTSPTYQNQWFPEHNLALVILYGSTLSKTRLIPVEVRFQHPAPAYAYEYKKIFQSPVFFNQEENAIIFNRKDILQRITPRNPHLQAVLIKHAKKKLKTQKQEDSFGRMVQNTILTRLPKGDITIEKISRELNTTRSTLHRKLKQEGVSFTSILELTRKELARTYLKQGMTVTQITYLLGFSHPGALQNAFKRWYKKSPGQLRKELTIVHSE